MSAAKKICSKNKKTEDFLKKYFIVSLLSILIFSALQAAEKPVVRFYLFYSDDCDICHNLMENTLPDLEEKYNLEYRKFEISDDKNLIKLMKLEAGYGKTAEIPEIFIGKYLIGGEEAAGKLENIIKEYAAVGCDFPQVRQQEKTIRKKEPKSPEPKEISKPKPKTEIKENAEIDKKQQVAKPKKTAKLQKIETKFSQNKPMTKPKSKEQNVAEATENVIGKKAEAPIYVAYFFKIGCQHCDRTYYDLEALKRKYPQMVVHEFNIADKDGMRMNEALCKLYQVPEIKHQATPIVFIGDKYFLGKNARLKNFEPIIRKNLKGGTEAPWIRAKPFLKTSEKSITERFQSFGVFTIIVAGLIDGINPCAFATIIFLISYLTLLGRKGKQILIIGAAYTLSVFITYFLVGILGLSILEYLQKLKFLTILIKIIFFVTGVLVLGFAFYSLYDYYLFKKGKTSEMVMQLPTKIKQKIHKSIREKSKMRNYVLAAFLIGFLVSLQELFCTGQVYLPTLVYMSRLSHFRNMAYFYLVIYNLLFIIPLIVVFMLVYWGMSSQILAKWMQKKLGTIKILMTIIFLALGIVLIASAFLK